MDGVTLRAMRDELIKISRFSTSTGKFIPEVGEKLMGLAKGVTKKLPGTPASRITQSGKFLPGAGSARGVVPPPLPSHAERARKMLSSNPDLAKNLQSGMGGEIRSAEGTLAMTLRGSGGRSTEAVRRAEQIGQLNTREVAKIREANQMLQANRAATKGTLRSTPRVSPQQSARAQMATGAATPAAMARPQAVTGAATPQALAQPPASGIRIRRGPAVGQPINRQVG